MNPPACLVDHVASWVFVISEVPDLWSVKLALKNRYKLGVFWARAQKQSALNKENKRIMNVNQIETFIKYIKQGLG